MVNIALFGPPGAGKGTQSALLKQVYDLEHIAPGDIFRAEVQRATPLGLQLQDYIDKGNFVPEELTIQLIGDRIASLPPQKNLLLDGYPRSLAQAHALEERLQKIGKPLHLVFFLDVNHAVVRERIARRSQHSGRADDQSEDVLNHRLGMYQNLTLPVARYYEEQQKLVKILGTGSIDDVQQRILAAIKPHLPIL